MPLGVIIPAAGRGDRLGSDPPKALVPLLGEPLLTHTCRALSALSGVHTWVVLAPPDARDAVERAARAGLGPEATLVVRGGGATRADSVRAGLAVLPDACDLVAVHDAARPCVSPAELRAVVHEAQTAGAAILACPCTDTVKRSEDGRTIAGTVDRSTLWLAQTPQVFRAALLREALAGEAPGTDEASAVERLGVPVRLVPGQPDNLKITTPSDLALAEALLRRAGVASCASDSVSTSIGSSPTAA